MSLITTYSSSESEDEESQAVLKTLKDPLASAVVPLKPENSLTASHSEPVNNIKRLVNAVYETQKLENASFEIQFREQNRKRLKSRQVLDSEGSTDTNTEEESGNEDSYVENEDDEPVEKFSTKFYGKQEKDYLGRSYMHIPRDLGINLTREAGSQECFIPKKQAFKWKGHVGGTNKIEFFPNSGHLLLSGGNDHQINLYDTFHNRPLLRKYFGHSRPVKDVTFAQLGQAFVSCGYDRAVNVWDTETGQLLYHLKVGSNPNCVAFHLQNEVIVGLANSKIQHYDIRQPVTQLVQTYDHHLDSVNSVHVVDNNSKIVSTSDDRSIRVWDLGINIPIKTISDIEQYSMPRAAVHPSKKYFATQSMNNKIMVYQADDRFRQSKNKIFTGHEVAGYAIGIGFSPDGKTLMSGGSRGYAYFWDWKSARFLKSYRVDDKSISTIAAHPQMTSGVAMAGALGTIFYWE